MKHENEPEEAGGLPRCNFCESEYDPHDRHTCKGNNIEPLIAGEFAKQSKDAFEKSTNEANAVGRGTSIEVPPGGWVFNEFGNPFPAPAPTVDDLIRINNEVSKIPYDKEWRTPVPPGYPDFEGLPGYKGSALDTQPGGDHYRKHAIQPVEYIDANGLDFFQGNIVKYATRHKDKGGAEDVRKIIHYAQIILELQYKETPK